MKYQLKHRLIGINGQIGSGKDTVTGMIQNHELCKDQGFENVKFATKLKQICGTLVGVDPINFEDQAFKKRLLPPMWRYYVVELDVVVMEPIMKKGKRAIASKTTTKTLRFDRLPNGMAIRSQWEAEDLMRSLQKEYPNHVEVRGIEKHFTYREMLQYIGTDLLRNQFHPDIHVMALFSEYKKKADSWDDQGNTTVESYPNWVISDTRFKNEAEFIRSKGGLLVRVERYQVDEQAVEKNNPEKIYTVMYHDGVGIVGKPVDGGEEKFLNYEDIRKHKPNAHPSETELDDYEFDVVIYNGDNLERLEYLVDKLVRNNIYETVRNERDGHGGDALQIQGVRDPNGYPLAGLL